MKRAYEKPEMKDILFDKEDIIVTSGPETDIDLASELQSIG